ncbi:MAG: hypothetical protein AB7E47_07785 [Desulfovibrionaceae bacterium]
MRLSTGKGRDAAKRRTEDAERCFQHGLNRGGMRTVWLRGQESGHRRYLLQVAGFNLGLLMLQLTGLGTSMGANDA